MNPISIIAVWLVVCRDLLGNLPSLSHRGKRAGLMERNSGCFVFSLPRNQSQPGESLPGGGGGSGVDAGSTPELTR